MMNGSENEKYKEENLKLLKLMMRVIKRVNKWMREHMVILMKTVTMPSKR